VFQMPRWFQTGQPLCQVKEQKEIAAALVGDVIRLAEDVAEHQQNNWKAFLRGDDMDGGYKSFDVPTVAFHNKHVWNATVSNKHIREKCI